MSNKISQIKKFNRMISLLKKNILSISIEVIINYVSVMSTLLIYILGAFGVVKVLDPNFTKIDSIYLYISIGVFALIKGVAIYLSQYYAHRNAYKIIGNLRSSLYTKLRDLCPAKTETKEKAESIRLLSRDINSFEYVSTKVITPIFVSILVELSIFVFLLVIANIYMALLSLFFFAIFGFLFPVIEAKSLRRDYEGQSQYNKEANSYLEDTIKGINDVSANNIYDVRYHYSVVRNELLFYKDRNIYIKEKIFRALYLLFVGLSIISSIFIGYLCVKNGYVTPHRLMVSILSIIVLLSFVASLKNCQKELNVVNGAMERIIDVITEKPLVEPINTANDFEFESLEARDISFEYDGRKILNNVELTVNKGEIVGIYSSKEFIGESTILKLFLRFYDITDGNIFYNNIDIKRINTKSLMDNVSLVSESTYIFNDTILNNIRIANSNASFDEVREACKLAHIDKYILSLDKGYDTEAKWIKNGLDSSTKQRIGLARAYLSKAPLILLDNICANADSIGQGLILRSIIDMSKNRTFLMLSKKKETLKIATRVYTIKEGNIIVENDD